ncbi:hypothetical protein JR316_0008728 [Psilocybe cubensis]|uniref:Uncharacterized protein n=4 Tax=Psilocybe cubensis TaxID=181762 RepID=A0ACB8GG48_PSICU|nr:uncharacterized protein JR316_0013524 [Psilocybe cubensis]XP_047741801.1 uncharacterized protein JR316_0013526 [Psilocybe cubensis]XP_047745894.1 hypothetical protein JR316_0008722 [Psilocybe cubensis]XP_047745900.1 hypothetical protein JR316_0008728 [Psilocybe cubensis]KAH9474174.1 hypothetical protein JR316_0013524 [Psilocybe cubensis]KAH9474176.1 hypothetical protein JR316_0013526 [Psilocybe cubensis]KAH9478269.1 hypothetical protein JR316_0008722 [Psilocybe cubensis]KAH9478275.1 hypot
MSPGVATPSRRRGTRMRLLSELEDENLESVFPSGGHAVENLGLLSELEDGVSKQAIQHGTPLTDLDTQNDLESVFPSGGHAVERTARD